MVNSSEIRTVSTASIIINVFSNKSFIIKTAWIREVS